MEKQPELFDAYDIDGNRLGKDIIRGEKIPNGQYHYIVEIYTINQNNECLVTLRDSQKIFPLYWEVTAGAVLKGETPRIAAKRELLEETGLFVQDDDFIELFKEKFNSCFVFGFVCMVHSEIQPITLQENETIDYQWISLMKMIDFVNRDDFVPSSALRFIKYYLSIKKISDKHRQHSTE